jgi:5'-3' exonuclease
MIELEADDALASAAYLAARNKRVEKVCIWTPDKDLGQCVVGDRVVQIDRRTNQIRNAAAVRAKFGVDPEYIADYLALVGDSADGYPGIPGCGAKTAANLIGRYGHIEEFPAEVFQDNNRRLALLFKDLATLRRNAPLFKSVEELRWKGPLESFPAVAKHIDDERLAERVQKLVQTLSK